MILMGGIAMKKKLVLAGILIGAVMSLTACGGETAQNIQENNEVQIGINQEKKANEIVDQMNSEYQNADDMLEGVTAE
jgi:maltose-binding protein MalE